MQNQECAALDANHTRLDRIAVRYRGGLLAFLLLMLIEAVLFRAGLAWKLPYYNSRNINHAAEKLRRLSSLRAVPDVVVLGSSWAEFSVDAKLIHDRTGLASENFAMISSSWQDQLRMFERIVDRFGKPPKYTILVFDPSHLERHAPMAYKDEFETWKSAVSGKTTVEDFLSFVMRRLFPLYRYRQDAEVIVLGVARDLIVALTGRGTNPYRFSTAMSARQQSIDVWMRERRWEKPFQPVFFHQRWAPNEIEEFLDYAGNFTKAGTRLLIVVPALGSVAPTDFFRRLEDAVASRQDMRVLDWNKRIALKPGEHFYDVDHLNPKGAAVYSEWIAKNIDGL
jgi:hypothetical protein